MKPDEPAIHIRADFEKMQPEYIVALAYMIKLAIEAVRRGDFDDEPPSPTLPDQ